MPVLQSSSLSHSTLNGRAAYELFPLNLLPTVTTDWFTDAPDLQIYRSGQQSSFPERLSRNSGGNILVVP
jgi:hypothetical protein